MAGRDAFNTLPLWIVRVEKNFEDMDILARRNVPESECGAYHIAVLKFAEEHNTLHKHIAKTAPKKLSCQRRRAHVLKQIAGLVAELVHSALLG
jgi:hypothetical protein